MIMNISFNLVQKLNDISSSKPFKEIEYFLRTEQSLILIKIIYIDRENSKCYRSESEKILMKKKQQKKKIRAISEM